MPRLSVWAIRLALVHLVIGWTLGALLLAHKGIFLHALMWRALPAHRELLLKGWTVQLVFGVAYWILPRDRGSRGDVRAALAAFALLNLGVAAVAAAPMIGGVHWLATAGRVLELAAGFAFLKHAWPRVRSLRS